MKKNLLIPFITFLSMALLVQLNVFAYNGKLSKKINAPTSRVLVMNRIHQDTTITGKALEKNLKYSRSVLNTDFDFSLKSTAKGKFSLSFFNDTNDVVAIKIYDVIGNLILTEQVSAQGSFAKEYDMSFYESDFFVVEVGSAKYNKTKTVIAV